MESITRSNDWHECDFVGEIKVYEKKNEPQKAVEIYDDYDIRNGFGMRMHRFKSWMDKQEVR